MAKKNGSSKGRAGQKRRARESAREIRSRKPGRTTPTDFDIARATKALKYCAGRKGDIALCARVRMHMGDDGGPPINITLADNAIAEAMFVQSQIADE